jgi:putative ATPase
MELFEPEEENTGVIPQELIPLAERIRAGGLSQVVGQEHLTSNGAVLEKMIANKAAFSMILWGPPGSGKTTLAKIIATETGNAFYQISAVSSGVKDLREIIAKAAAAARKGARLGRERHNQTDRRNDGKSLIRSKFSAFIQKQSS